MMVKLEERSNDNVETTSRSTVDTSKPFPESSSRWETSTTILDSSTGQEHRRARQRPVSFANLDLEQVGRWWCFPLDWAMTDNKIMEVLASESG